MNLLIIDDQTSVVNGLMRGIEWKLMGINEIFCAFNAFEAKKIFKAQQVDIMLCDIEMPLENGLKLLEWVRANGYTAECIFLTAHAEFEYAKEALALGSFDYVVQPAPYDSIKNVVLRAIQKVSERQEEKRTYEFGRYMQGKSDLFCSRTMSDWLKQNLGRGQYEDFAQVESMPSLETRGYLVLMQTIRQMIPIDQWEPSLMRFTFENVLGEIFAPYDQRVLLCDIDKTLYALVIYGPNGYTMDYAGVLRQLEVVRDSFSRFIQYEGAFYTDEAGIIADMPLLLTKLQNICHENVSMRSMVFNLSNQEKNDGFNEPYMLMQMRCWQDFISRQFMETVQDDVFAYLDRMDAEGKLNRSALMHFHVELCRMLYTTGENMGMDIRGALENHHTAQLYTKAPQSLADMKNFIVCALELFRKNGNDEYQQRNQIHEIERYIHDHMECDIHRDDIADYVHLNVDYIGRLFKKNKGIAIKEYIIDEKMRMAQKLLRTTMLPVSFVASKVGYSNFSHFSRIYKKINGISPTEERRTEKEAEV